MSDDKKELPPDIRAVLVRAFVQAIVKELRGEISAPPQRLMTLKQAATYLGLSYWTLRDYALAGRIQPVKLPPLTAREGEKQKADLRRILFDKKDLDAFVDSLKETK